MKYKIIILTILLSYGATAQQEMNLYNMTYIPQAQQINPALIPSTKFHFGFGFNANLTAPMSYNDIVESKTNDTVTINATRFYNNLNKNNIAAIGIVPEVSLGFKLLGRAYASFGIREVVNTSLSIPRDFFDFAINGNGGSSIGTAQNIGNFSVSMMHYREFSAGLAYKFNCKWGFGARLKYLMGYQNIQTVKSNLFLTTDPNTYAMTMSGDYQINASGLDSASMDKFTKNPIGGTGNSGFGIDLGTTYKFNDKIDFSASVVDLGFITWKNGNSTIQNNSNTNYVFSGIPISEIYKNNSTSYLSNVLDSIKNRFNFKETSNPNSYSTWLNTKIYLNATYKPIKNTAVGATLGLNSNYGTFLPSFSAFGRIDLYKIMQFQINYLATTNSMMNIGLGTAFNLGFVQLHFVSDNLVGTAFNPKGSKNVNLRAGLNFLWSYGKEKDKTCLNEAEKNVEKLKEVLTTKETVEEVKPTTPDVPTISGTTPPPPTPPTPPKVDESVPKNKVETIISSTSDIDQDLVMDQVDLCPTLKGDMSNNGCPTDINTKALFTGNLLLFEPGKTNLYPIYENKLKTYFNILKNDSTQKMALMLHNTKEEAASNTSLGFNRADYIHELLKSFNIDPSRVMTINRGVTMSVEGSEQNPSLNSSAEMKLIGKK